MPGSEEPREKNAKPGWYVLQVRTGQEQRMCTLVEHACDAFDKAAKNGGRVGLRECFSPQFRSQKKWKGEWLDLERPLLPGYVIADVGNPAMLAQAVRPIRELCRLLAADDVYEPLDERERAWMDSSTRTRDRVIPLSFGYKEGDTLTIVEGPLKGNEALITKFDRKNSLAHLELHTGQITIKAKVGLAIMPSGKVRQLAG